MHGDDLLIAGKVLYGIFKLMIASGSRVGFIAGHNAAPLFGAHGARSAIG